MTGGPTRILAVARRILRQFRRDPRTLALVLLAPTLVLTLLSEIFEGDEYRPTIATVGLPEPMARALESHGANVVSMEASEAEDALAAARVDAVLSMDGWRPNLRIEGSDPAKSQAVMLALHEAAGDVSPLAARGKPEVSFLHGSADMDPFDSFGPILLGFIVFFFTFIVSGISFVRERTSGTLERMLATPLRRWEVVGGYALGFAGVVVLQSSLLVTVSVYLLDMGLAGSFGWLLAVALLLAAAAMTLAMFLSAYARTEFQMIQFVPVVMIPQIFFAGIFPLEAMAPWLRWIGRVLPLTYGARAMRQVMVRGAGLGAIAPDLAVLAAFALVFLAANVRALKRVRAI
ncbi:MAG: ABC transporter permease [Planctomycetes bacterium]|nr:ABC transporter permease [Planctomycetota bacterium]